MGLLIRPAANGRRRLIMHKVRTHLSICITAIITISTYAAGTYRCYERPGTLEYSCIDPAATTVNGDLRASPLYQGGPKGVTKTALIFLADCRRGISTLQDRNGSNFAGAKSADNAGSRVLSKELCAVQSPRQDPTIRQF